MYAGGSESNGWTATLLERRLVTGVSFHPMELLLIASNRFVTSDYVLRTTPDPVTEPGGFYGEWSGGGDVGNYLGLLSTIHVGSAGITPTGSSELVRSEYRRLKRQAYWNALDPGAWLSLWAAGAYIVTGRDPCTVPLPRIRGRTFLPILSADWLPDGGVASLELVLGPSPSPSSKFDPEWLSLTVRRGRGPEGSFGAIGAGAERLWESCCHRLSGEIEAWSRPGRGLGGGVRVRVLKTSGPFRDFFYEAGVKSAGHWPGRPAGVGPFVRIGYLLR
jgi:hypothetical protein